MQRIVLRSPEPLISPPAPQAAAPAPQSAAAARKREEARKKDKSAASLAKREEDKRVKAVAHSRALRAALLAAAGPPPPCGPADVRPDWTIAEIAARTVGGGWAPTFAAAAASLRLISKILDARADTGPTMPSAIAPTEYYPLKPEIFRAFYLTPLAEVKVVIIASDQYAGVVPGSGLPEACGLAFSTRPGAPLSLALVKVFEELAATFPAFAFAFPETGDLEPWARRGVLLLSSALTVAPGAPRAHVELWRGFTKRVVEAVVRSRPLAVFLLWGAEAQDEFLPLLGERAAVFTAPHPTSRYKRDPFLGCGHFAKVAEHLARFEEGAIDWSLNH